MHSICLHSICLHSMRKWWLSNCAIIWVWPFKFQIYVTHTAYASTAYISYIPAYSNSKIVVSKGPKKNGNIAEAAAITKTIMRCESNETETKISYVCSSFHVMYYSNSLCMVLLSCCCFFFFGELKVNFVAITSRRTHMDGMLSPPKPIIGNYNMLFCHEFWIFRSMELCILWINGCCCCFCYGFASKPWLVV